MRTEKLDMKLVYENYIVKGARQLYDVLFIKTCDKETGEIIWFMGYPYKNETISATLHRILAENKKFPNSYLKAIFAEDKVSVIKLDKIKFE